MTYKECDVDLFVLIRHISNKYFLSFYKSEEINTLNYDTKITKSRETGTILFYGNTHRCKWVEKVSLKAVYQHWLDLKGVRRPR